MSGYFAISLKKQQKSKYNLCKHQFRGNLKIKNQSISPKRLVGIESNVSHHVLLNFLDYKPLSELLKNFSCITLERRWRVYCPPLPTKCISFLSYSSRHFFHNLQNFRVWTCIWMNPNHQVWFWKFTRHNICRMKYSSHKSLIYIHTGQK